MSDKLMPVNFSNMRLADFHFHIDGESWKESYIELMAEGSGKKLHLKFQAPDNLCIERGFNGSLSGMQIIDISDRHWDSACVEVVNLEQDAGITFFAASMEIISNI